MTPPNICHLPFSRTDGSPPFAIISTTPYMKTMIATANININIGLTILAMIGSRTLPKAAPSTLASAIGTILCM